MKLLCILFSLLAWMTPLGHAVTILFGGEFGASNISSDGTSPLSGMTFAVGSFDVGFTPDSSNVSSWQANWSEFDTATYNPMFGYFASEGQLTDNTQIAANAHGYLWVYNTQEAGPTSEWALITNESWLFPAAAVAETHGLPIRWTITDPGTTPVFGAHAGNQAPQGGDYQEPTQSFSLQTHITIAPPIPEPSASVLLLISAALLGTRRRVRSQ